MLDPTLYPKADERKNAVQVPAAVIYDDERLLMELPRKFAAILFCDSDHDDNERLRQTR